LEEEEEEEEEEEQQINFPISIVFSKTF